MRMEISASSLSAFSQDLRAYSQRLQSTSDIALHEVTEQIFKIAQSRVPVATGTLRSSGRITKMSAGDVNQYVISYGTPLLNPKTHRTASSYAVSVHETFNKVHPDSYKWLERSLTQNSELFRQSLEALLRNSLGG